VGAGDEEVGVGVVSSGGAKGSTNEVADAPSLGDPVLLDERQAVAVGINLEGFSAEPVRACLLPWPRRRVLSKSLNETRRRPQCSQNAERCPAELITELVGNGRDAAAIRTKTDACAADIDARARPEEEVMRQKVIQPGIEPAFRQYHHAGTRCAWDEFADRVADVAGTREVGAPLDTRRKNRGMLWGRQHGNHDVAGSELARESGERVRAQVDRLGEIELGG